MRIRMLLVTKGAAVLLGLLCPLVQAVGREGTAGSVRYATSGSGDPDAPAYGFRSLATLQADTSLAETEQVHGENTAIRYVLTRGPIGFFGGEQFEFYVAENRFISFDGIERSRVPAALTPCLLYTSPSPRDRTRSRMPSSA